MFAQMEYGAGHVSVFADQYLWGNDHIGDEDNARLLATGLGSVRQPVARFTSATPVPVCQCITMLWQRLRWFCVLMMVLGLALLRRSWVRFGPLQTLPETRSNNFARHLLSVAQFQGRYQSVDQLLGPARQRVLSRYIDGHTCCRRFCKRRIKNITADRADIQSTTNLAGQLNRRCLRAPAKQRSTGCQHLAGLDRVVEK